MRNRLVAFIFLSALCVSGCSIIDGNKPVKGDIVLDFYNINDFHGAVTQNGDEPGIFKLSSFIKEQMAKNKDYSVFTNSGDMWQGSADSNLTSGALVTDWLNYLDCKAMALGNHEFDWKIEKIEENEEKMNFPMLACNVYDLNKDEYVSDWLTPYTTIQKGDIKIGFIGAIGEGLTSSISAGNVRGLEFRDPTPKVIEFSTYLRETEKCDVIIYLLHDDIANVPNTIASYVDGLFLGHSHRYYTSTLEKDNKTLPYVQAWSNGKAVGHIKIGLTLKDGKYEVNSSRGEFIRTRSSDLTSYSEDSGAISVYQSYEDEIDAIKNREVARIPSYLDQYDNIPFLYNKYACDYYRDVLEGDKEIVGCVTNNGRAPLKAGVVTFGDIYKSLPFDNCLTVMEITGDHLGFIAEQYSSSRWYIPSVSTSNPVDNYDVRNAFNAYQTYYFLAIDYVSTYTGYEDWMVITDTYNDDASMPRNIFAQGLATEYPL